MGLDIHLHKLAPGKTVQDFIDHQLSLAVQIKALDTEYKNRHGNAPPEQSYINWPDHVVEDWLVEHSALRRKMDIPDDQTTDEPRWAATIKRWYLRASPVNRTLHPILGKDLHWAWFEMIVPKGDMYDLFQQDGSLIWDPGEFPAVPYIHPDIGACLPLGGWAELSRRAQEMQNSLPLDNGGLRHTIHMVNWIENNPADYFVWWSA